MTPFYKFHGTGNDFIMVDGFTSRVALSQSMISEACNRHYGIGADGLIMIVPSEHYDFEMIYYNSDGSLASMCGNGARCAVAFFRMLGSAANDVSFEAGDGVHHAHVEDRNDNSWYVDVSMKDVCSPIKHNDVYYINTGTHHTVKLVDDVNRIDIGIEGPLLRNDGRFEPHGVNVNWASMAPGQIAVRTYEKGVEAETLSCGTGVTASAIIAGLLTKTNEWKVKTKGGMLEVTYYINNDCFTNIRLKGPAVLAFSGQTSLLY